MRMTIQREHERVDGYWRGGLWSVVLIVILTAMLLCHVSVARAGWFVPENRIAWEAWRDGDDAVSLKHWDHSSKGIFGRATVLMRTGHLREAVRGFRRALAGAVGAKPAYIASIWYNLGNGLYAEGALRQAQQAWHEALRYNPGHTKAAHNLAIVRDLLKGKREKLKRAGVASRMVQGRKRRRLAHNGKNQGGSGLPVSGKEAEQRKEEKTGDGGNVKSVSQAKREVNAVHDSMGVFLRHRMSEKSVRTVPSRRGPPW